MLFLALLPAKRKTARFAFRAAKPGLCPALRGLLFALGGQRLPGLCAHAGLRRLGAGGPHGTLEARRFLRRAFAVSCIICSSEPLRLSLPR